MDDRNEIIHRLLDGDPDEEERARIWKRIEADPGLAEELRQLNGVMKLLARSGMRSPGADFTASVMSRLTERRTMHRDRVLSFLFGERVLRWNVATAALAAMLVAVTIIAVRPSGPPGVRTPADPSAFPVTFRLYAPQARQVELAGEFNRWQPDATKLQPEGGGFWSVQVQLSPGMYSYMFVLDGTVWVTDPHAELHRDDGFGYRNAVLRVEQL